MKIYLAAGLKTNLQRERNIRIAELIEARRPGDEVYLPQKYMILEPDASYDQRMSVYNENINAIRDSQMVIAILDEGDKGTIWEMGYAAGIIKPVVGLYWTPEAKINVMLTMSCLAVCHGSGEFIDFLETGTRYLHRGETE